MKVLKTKEVADIGISTLEIKGRGDGMFAIHKLIKSLKSSQFVVLDPDMIECVRAYYFHTPSFSGLNMETLKEDGWRSERKITVQGGYDLTTLIEMVANINLLGAPGHSYEIHTSKGFKDGWDGDGADYINEMKLNGIKIQTKDFGDYEPKWKTKLFELLRKGKKQ